MLIGKSWVSPADSVASTELFQCRIQQVSAADFLKSTRSQLANDQFPTFIEHPSLVAILHEVDCAPASLGSCRLIFPDPLPGIRIQATSDRPGLPGGTFSKIEGGEIRYGGGWQYLQV